MNLTQTHAEECNLHPHTSQVKRKETTVIQQNGLVRLPTSWRLSQGASQSTTDNVVCSVCLVPQYFLCTSSAVVGYRSKKITSAKPNFLS